MLHAYEYMYVRTYRSEQDHNLAEKTSLKLCSQCLSVVSRGKTHSCNRQTQIENLNELASSSHHTEQLATKVILDKCDSSPNDQITLDRVGRGHPVRIAVSPFAEDPKPLFQAGDIKTIHLDLILLIGLH